MAIKGYFFNAVQSGGTYDRTYNAEDVTSYLDEIVGSGVFPTPSTQLQVSAGTGMQVIVAPGQGWINGHKIINTADLPLTIAAADTLLKRIDRVVFYADYTNREMGIDIVQGTAAVNPTAPALTRTAARYEMSLATITVNKQATAITGSAITDTRADSSVCGWVAGLIQQVDTSTLFTQWNTAYSEFMQTMESWMTTQKATFESWLSTLTSELTVGAYIRSFDKYVELTASDSSIVALDMTGYEYEESDVFLISINGLKAAPDEDYLIDTRTSPVQVHLNTTTSESTTNDVYIQVLKSVLGVPTAGGGSTTKQVTVDNTSRNTTTTTATAEVTG